MNLIKEITNPNINEPWILVPVILMTIAIMFPLMVWFIRNFIRIILNKNIEWLNRGLKWFFLAGFIIFIISIIILALFASGVIK